MSRTLTIILAASLLAACGGGIDKKPIESNDPDGEPSDEEIVEVNNDTNNVVEGGERCVELSTGRLEFGPVRMGQASQMSFQILNCSASMDLAISSIEAPSPFIVEMPTAPTLAPGESVAVPVQLNPVERSVYIADLIVETDAGTVSLELEGEALDESCPQATAKMFTDDDPTSRDGGSIPTLTTVTLSGAASQASDEITAWEWTLVDAPASSTSRISDADDERATLYADTIGTYEVELRVFTSDSPDDCPADRLAFEAVPGAEGDILVQLTWDTPTDADQTDDAGTDLDLHWLHPSGEWNEAPYDCYWLNVEADWGSDGVARVDIDDTNGAGPENISHTNAGDEVYQVGVHYFSDNGYGPSYATVRVFMNGAQVFEERDVYLDGKDAFWHGIEVDWTERDVFADQIITSGFPASD